MAKVDWYNKQSVCDYCKQLAHSGKVSLLVTKYKGRSNYNITHKARPDIWQRPDVEVIYEVHMGERT